MILGLPKFQMNYKNLHYLGFFGPLNLKIYKTSWKCIKDRNCISNISAGEYLYKMVLCSKRFYGGHVSNRNRLRSCMVLILGEIELISV